MKNRALVLGLVLVVVGVLLGILLPPGPREPTDTPFVMDLEYETAPFVELIYEQGFAPLPPEPSPPVDGAIGDRPGYVFRAAANRLLYVTGQDEVPRGDLHVGHRLVYRRATGDGTQVFADLEATNGATWDPAESPLLGGDPGLVDPLLRARASIPVSVSADPDGCRVTFAGEESVLAPGDSKVLVERTEGIPFDDFVSSIEPWLDPGTGAEPGRLDALRESLDAGDGTVDLFVRLSAVFHGPVEVCRTDLAYLKAEAVRAARRGRWVEAEVRLRVAGNLDPEDAGTWNLLADVRRHRREGSERHRVHGRIAGADPDEPVVFSARRDADRPGHWPVVVEAREDSYELFLPPGEWEIRALSGSRPSRRTRLEVSGDRTWSVNFADDGEGE